MVDNVQKWSVKRERNCGACICELIAILDANRRQRDHSPRTCRTIRQYPAFVGTNVRPSMAPDAIRADACPRLGRVFLLWGALVTLRDLCRGGFTITRPLHVCAGARRDNQDGCNNLVVCQD